MKRFSQYIVKGRWVVRDRWRGRTVYDTPSRDKARAVVSALNAWRPVYFAHTWQDRVYIDVRAGQHAGALVVGLEPSRVPMDARVSDALMSLERNMFAFLSDDAARSVWEQQP